LRYCSASHRQLAYVERKARAELLARNRSAQTAIQAAAPPRAALYKLGIRLQAGGDLVFFPRRGRGFALQPFDPPIVPRSGLYVVRYFSADGAPLGTPIRIVEGVWVEGEKDD
jgi:hypothetical protein